MNPKEFVQAIKNTIYDSTISGVLNLLLKPPGRRPRASLVELSRWYNNLSESDKDSVRAVIELVTHHSIFGFLAVLDGVEVIESTPKKGDLKLYYKIEEHEVLINDPSMEFLHDLFQEEMGYIE